MAYQQQESYLESRILTAPPHQLHLRLIEGALRFGRRAHERLERGDHVAAAIPLLRAIDIISEMLAGVREQRTEVNRQIAEFYWFLFRRVSEAKLNGDAAALAEVLQLLEYERETWQLVCEKLAAQQTSAPIAPPHARPARAPQRHAAGSSFSLDA